MNKKRCQMRQQGAALLVFMLLMLLAGSAAVFNFLHPQSRLPTEQDRQLLLQAKQALLGYALRYGDLHPGQVAGHLPCPDQTGDGLQNKPCGVAGQSAMGWLPWKTLGLPPLRDQAGSCLWYAVSGAFKTQPAGRLSTVSRGQFLLFNAQRQDLNGGDLNNAAIAVILAPGAPLNGQSRGYRGVKTECGSQSRADPVNQSKNYLEAWAGVQNFNGDVVGWRLAGTSFRAIPSTGYSAFMDSGRQSQGDVEVFNDTLLALQRSDFQGVYQMMQNQVGDKVKQCIEAYARERGNLPESLPGERSTHREDDHWPDDPQKPGTKCFTWQWWRQFKSLVDYSRDQDKPLAMQKTLSWRQLIVSDGKQQAFVRVAMRRTTSESGHQQEKAQATETTQQEKHSESAGDSHSSDNEKTLESDHSERKTHEQH